MKKNLSILLFFISILTFAQIKFKEGYIINNEGVKTFCLIRDMAWKDYPDSFLFKDSEDGKQKRAYIQNIKEFSVDNIKYVRFTFKLDISSTNLNYLSDDKKPIWESKTAFLKLLVDGSTQLYKYSSNGNVKYFIKKENRNDIEQLVYKKYMIEKNNQNYVQTNNDFKIQLDSINKNFATRDIIYSDKSLISWFNKNSGIQNTEVIDKENGKFNIRAKVGFLSSQLKFKSSSGVFSNLDLDKKTSINPSLEFEYVFAFNKNKWSAFIEPTYFTYTTEKTTETILSFIDYKKYVVDYSSIIIPIGIKHYIFVNDKSKFFISGAFAGNFALKYKIRVFDPTINYNYSYYDDRGTIFMGTQLSIGYIYNNKFSIEGKLINQKSIINSSTDAKQHSFGFSIGYNIF